MVTAVYDMVWYSGRHTSAMRFSGGGVHAPRVNVCVFVCVCVFVMKARGWLNAVLAMLYCCTYRRRNTGALALYVTTKVLLLLYALLLLLYTCMYIHMCNIRTDHRSDQRTHWKIRWIFTEKTVQFPE